MNFVTALILARTPSRSYPVRSLNASAHDNYANFPGATSVNFNVTMHSITSGQPYEGVRFSGSTLDIKAGRKGSAGPVADFSTGVTLANAIGLETEWPHITQLPKELNFMIKGTLSFTFSSGNTHYCEDMRLGQGHHGTDNNWWIASKHCTSIPTTAKFVCRDLRGMCDLTFLMGDNDHSFEVRETDQTS
jgi:hypothetical protein